MVNGRNNIEQMVNVKIDFWRNGQIGIGPLENGEIDNEQIENEQIEIGQIDMDMKLRKNGKFYWRQIANG